MRILQINATYGDGSTGTIMADIHKLVSQQNDMESYVAYSTSSIPAQDIQNGYKIGNSFGKKLHALLCRFNGNQAYFSTYSTKKILRYIDKNRPDLVHLHNRHSNYINLNLLLSYLAKHNIKTVVTLHDCWFYTGGCFHYTAAGCDKWKSRCGNCPKKKKDTPAYFLDRSTKILNDRKKHFGAIKDLTVVGVSKWISEEAAKGVFKNAHIRTIYNGIDTDLFKPSPSDFRKQYDGKFILLGPASKWLSTVNKEIFETVVSRLKEDEVLVLLGCKAAEGLPEKVLPLSYIRSREELCKVYSAADVFVNPTREESLSLINVEAQACGTPVVTFSNTGVKETVDHSSGKVVENGNPSAFCEAVFALLKQSNAGLSSHSRAFVLQRFELKNNYQKYIELYRSKKELR